MFESWILQNAKLMYYDLHLFCCKILKILCDLLLIETLVFTWEGVFCYI